MIRAATDGQLPPGTVSKPLLKWAIFLNCHIRILNGLIPVSHFKYTSYYRELLFERLAVSSAIISVARNYRGVVCGRGFADGRGHSYAARISLLLVSYKSLVVIKASVAKDAVNLLRKATIELRKLGLGKGRATKQSAELRLCSWPNSLSKRFSR